MRVIPAQSQSYDLPYSTSGYSGADFTYFTFEDCEIHVSFGGVGVDVRASQSVPMRFRRCDFSGHAAAFMSLWNATHYIEDCRFHNAKTPDPIPPLAPGSRLRGFEAPEGSDLFLRQEYPRLDEFGRPRYATDDYLPGVVAIGCVSRSQRFLSSARPNPNQSQQQHWPVVLVNVRHRPSESPLPSVPSVAVRWGQTNIVNSIGRGLPEWRQLGYASPLIIVGGSFSGLIVILRGAVQSAVVGSRVQMIWSFEDVENAAFWGTFSGSLTPGVVFDDQVSGWGSDEAGTRQVHQPTIVFGLLEDRSRGWRLG